MPLPSASSVRSADATAALAGSVPDEFVISGFELAMSWFQGDEGIGFCPEPFLSTVKSVMRRGPPFSTAH